MGVWNSLTGALTNTFTIIKTHLPQSIVQIGGSALNMLKKKPIMIPVVAIGGLVAADAFSKHNEGSDRLYGDAYGSSYPGGGSFYNYYNPLSTYDNPGSPGIFPAGMVPVTGHQSSLGCGCQRINTYQQIPRYHSMVNPLNQ